MQEFDNFWASPEMIENINMKIIDIRTPFEWSQTGIVKDSYTLTFFDSMGRYDIKKFIEELDTIVHKDEQFAIICRTGSRTSQVSSMLNQHYGYNSVNLKGGILKLIGEGYRTQSYN